jgi:hypothetical protein
MARNTYYRTPHWRALKRACHDRDGWKCVAPGCGGRDALVCDHIKTRPNADVPTPADVLANVRTLCGYHDRQVKEQANGARRQAGEFRQRIKFDANGWPI